MIDKFKKDYQEIKETLIPQVLDWSLADSRYNEILKDINNGVITKPVVEFNDKQDRIVFTYVEGEIDKTRWIRLLRKYDCRLGIDVTKEYKSKIKAYCANKGISMRELIINLLENEMSKED